jgi:peptidoglycan/LPS O-acetylase OafA/YrhL
LRYRLLRKERARIAEAALRDTLGRALERQGGVGGGFNTLRVVLALGVVFFHSIDVTGAQKLGGSAWFWAEALLPTFFALSGFLITGSAQRLPLSNFLANRGLRIFPALLVEITLSAVLLGALLTTLPLEQYFTDPGFWRYFGNVTGWIQYVLPGVFEQNPKPAVVNMSLWTIPWELACYALMVIMILTRALHSRRLILALAVAAALAPVLAYTAAEAYEAWRPGGFLATAWDSHNYFTPPQLHASALGLAAWALQTLTGWEFRVVPYFLAGCAAYLYRDALPYSATLLVAALVALPAAAVTIPAVADGVFLNAALCPLIIYAMAAVGVSPLPALPLFSKGDYSYGIYLYGFPVQQTVVWTGIDQGHWWANFAISAVLATLAAAASWHVVEKPILRRRSAVIARLDAMARTSRSPAAST